MKLQTSKAILLGLVSTFSTISLMSLSVVTMPLVTSQPVFAQSKAIYGKIFDKWAILGGTRSILGEPITDELPAARGGRYNEFQGGYIYWHPNFGAYAVYGKIGEKWNQLGRENGVGYPSTDELPAANGGRYNEFEGGSKYIYWHPNTGAHIVYGDIARSWNQLGRERGRLGYPISDEEAVGTAGQRVSRFQGGEVYWNSGTRKLTITYK